MGLDDQGVRVQVPEGTRIFTPSCRPGRHWGPPNIYVGKCLCTYVHKFVSNMYVRYAWIITYIYVMFSACEALLWVISSWVYKKCETDKLRLLISGRRRTVGWKGDTMSVPRTVVWCTRQVWAAGDQSDANGHELYFSCWRFEFVTKRSWYFYFRESIH